MNKKARNWQVAFPLAITSLCVAPQSYFLKHWLSLFEASISKLKVGLKPPYVGVHLIFLVGTTEQGDSTERPAATGVDISLPLPRVCLDDHGQTRDVIEALLPL